MTEELADCILQLHCIAGCDANSGFYGFNIMDYNINNLDWTGLDLELDLINHQNMSAREWSWNWQFRLYYINPK